MVLVLTLILAVDAAHLRDLSSLEAIKHHMGNGNSNDELPSWVKIRYQSPI
jgi:hypothetical protein